MNTDILMREFESLPEDKQAEVLDFVVALKAREGRRTEPKGHQSIRDAKFIGMWADRGDMSDSSAWVRQVRESQWDRHG